MNLRYADAIGCGKPQAHIIRAMIDRMFSCFGSFAIEAVRFAHRILLLLPYAA